MVPELTRASSQLASEAPDRRESVRAATVPTGGRSTSPRWKQRKAASSPVKISADEGADADSVPRPDRSLSSDLQQRTAPGEAGTEADCQNEIARLNAARTDGFVERDRNTAGKRIPVTV